MKSFRVHSGRIQHDIVRCTIPERDIDKDLHMNRSSVPMCDISLVHESEALCQGISGAYALDQMMHKSHITYLCEEGHELAKGLETGFIEAAQVRHHNQLLIMGVW
jgi:hypothetical protein